MGLDVPSDPSDATLVDVHPPEGIGEASLEALERYGIADDPDHDPVALQDTVDGDLAHPKPATSENGVDP